ncbi:class I SAM-dependent methyltransferase [Bordetella genomosp. 4]|uniref:SAM-dependent methyltransferase n=1 Tax=Bordetella genomosp. 4 TaxID=463044 RepID=A0A261UTG1_9BORD|nr:methyltransferase domain-containing protein [Bordetella genomosp. 4]OZI64945.1 SAM-dependent methyltransferase [Bordetella genomosp. 4]
MTEETPPIVELAEWFQTPPGQYVLAWERSQFDAIVADVFGYYAWQVGFAEFNLLQANRMPFKGWVGTQMPGPEQAALWQGCVVARPDALPFESQSVDLLVLPHAFECTDSPHDVLREAERVLVPEGRVVISGFNPWSLWGARNWTPGMEPWLPLPPSAQVSLPRLKDWLKLMSFNVGSGRFGCYAPACRTEKWLQRWQFMETYGQRWWAVGGAVYVVSAVKRVAGMRLVGPAWKSAKRRRRTRAAPVVVNREAGPGKT